MEKFIIRRLVIFLLELFYGFIVKGFFKFIDVGGNVICLFEIIYIYIYQIVIRKKENVFING